jgi:peptide/nickel transport system permease protein
MVQTVDPRDVSEFLGDAPEAVTSSEPRIWHTLWAGVRRSPLALICLCVLTGWVLVAIFGPMVTGQDPNLVVVSDRLVAPSGKHWLGTDEFGRDVATRMFDGARVSLSVGAATTVISLVLGTAVGAIAGSFRRVSAVIMRAIDALLAYPSLLLAIVLVAVVGQGTWQMMVALTSVYLPLFARIVYAEVRALKDLDFAQASRVLGSSDLRVMWRHLIPAMASPLIVQASFVLATAITFESSLSFVGAGVPPPQASWGSMINEGKTYIFIAPWILWSATAALTSLVLAVSLIGDRLRDLLDPRSLSSLPSRRRHP